MKQLAEDYGVGYQKMTNIISSWLEKTGLNKDKRFIYKAPLAQDLSGQERTLIYSMWNKNPFVPKADKELLKTAKATIKEYNKIFPNDKKSIDHIMAFINSKNKVDAHTIDNLNITDAYFNSVIKMNLFEKLGGGFRQIASQIKNTKDMSQKKELMRFMKEAFNRYEKIVKDAGYFMDTTGMPFLPKVLQKSTKQNVRTKLIDDINSLQGRIKDARFEAGTVMSQGYSKGGRAIDFSKYRETYADGGTLMKYRTLMKDLAQLVS